MLAPHHKHKDQHKAQPKTLHKNQPGRHQPRHILTLLDVSAQEILDILKLAETIKKNPQKYGNSLKNKTLTMIFQKNSTRTRLSFEAGMTQLGGHAIFLDWRTTQLGIASLEDEGRVISHMSDIIMARLLKHADLVKIAENSRVPVINGLCEKFHPCQSLGDLLTMKEKLAEQKRTLKGATVTYVGIANNVSNTLVVACTQAGMRVVLCTPEVDPLSQDYHLDRYFIDAKKKGLLVVETDLKKAVKDADFVYTDTWVNMEFFTDPSFAKEKARRLKIFMPYAITSRVLSWCKKDVMVMHDMPIHHGYEMTKEVVEGPHSIIFDQAENRLHIEKAMMVWLLAKSS